MPSAAPLQVNPADQNPTNLQYDEASDRGLFRRKLIDRASI